VLRRLTSIQVRQGCTWIESSWLKAATLTLLFVAAPANAQAAPAQTSQTKAKKPKPPVRAKRARKTPVLPVKPPGETPEVKEAASVWRGCLESRDVPKLALNLGVSESRLEPLLSELDAEGIQCVPYVAATGGEGGAASLIFQRPKPMPGESPILDIRKTADGITVTPGACDCPEPVRRVLAFPALDAQRHDEILASVPGNVRWELDTLLPQMIGRLAPKGHLDSGPDLNFDSNFGAGPSAEDSKSSAQESAYTVRIALDRSGENEPEHLQSVEILESTSGKCVDGAWWLDRPGGPGVFIGMQGLAYERLLWQSPINYLKKSRGVGPAMRTYRRRVPPPKGSTAKPTTRTVAVRGFHLGADLMAPKGTEVHTVGDAKVAFAGRMGGFGKLIILNHGLGYQTYYAHLSVIRPEIKVGASVARGDVIGLVGSTGHSTAPHLHFETRKDAKYVDPFDNTRQWHFWLLTPDDQERLAMELLASPSGTAVYPTDSDGEQHKASRLDQ
jgi:murein DD-endopeptidase MepM/ murein hydrolase activator NlpD